MADSAFPAITPGQGGGENDIAGNKVIMAVVKEIYSSITFGSERLKAVMNLPPVSQVDNETLSLALQFILEKYFRLSFPAQEIVHVRAGRSVKFTEEEPADNLPPRRISILLSPEHRSFEVSGAAAENGRDGYSELLFSWKSQAGQVDKLGNIDLKKLNTYPNAFTDQPLATIYLRTEGKAGVNCLGKKIKQRPGQPLKVKYNEITIYQKEDPKDRDKYSLIARKGGMVEYILGRKEDPRSLMKLDILDTITINGDVDYAIGDQGSLTQKGLECTSNIIVKGNVLGVFTLQTSGYIHISGAFEGKKAVAEEIVVDTITSDSNVVARRNVVASNIIRAMVESKTIILRNNANEAKLFADDLIRLEQNASCLALTMYARKLESISNRFSGRTKLCLGDDLFSREKGLLTSLKLSDEEIVRTLPEVKEAASVVITDLADIESRINSAGALQHQDVRTCLAEIKRMLVGAIQSMAEPLNEQLIPNCHKLQGLLGDRKVHESVIRKIENFLSPLKKFGELLEGRSKQVNFHRKTKEELASLRGEARQLAADFQAPSFIGSNAEIEVVCGESEILLNAATVPSQNFSVSFHPEKDAVGIGKGTLKLDVENQGNF